MFKEKIAKGVSATITGIGTTLLVLAVGAGMKWAMVGSQPFHDHIALGLGGFCIGAIGVFLYMVADEEL